MTRLHFLKTNMDLDDMCNFIYLFRNCAGMPVHAYTSQVNFFGDLLINTKERHTYSEWEPWNDKTSHYSHDYGF